CSGTKYANSSTNSAPGTCTIASSASLRPCLHQSRLSLGAAAWKLSAGQTVDDYIRVCIQITRPVFPKRYAFFGFFWMPVAPHLTACHYPKLSLEHGNLQLFCQRETRSNALPGSMQHAPKRWAEEQFAGTQLTDIRRVAQVKTIAEAMAVHPGRSVPQLCDSPYAVKATYNLFQHEEATPENLQAGHRALVLEAMGQPGIYLLLEDTTELSWAGKHPIRGLGPIGNRAAGLQGFFLHTVLSVRWPEASQDTSKRRPGEVLGRGDQQYYVRTPCRRPRESSQERLRRARESQVWPQASQHLGHAPQDVQWIRVADREADIYASLVSCQALGHGFVIRAAKDRALSHPETGKRAGRLLTAARSAVPLGELTLELRQRPQHPARTAHLCVRATA